MSKEMRGLSQFISSLRGAENKEEEQARVNKELVNIRAKFTSTTQLSDYDKRKYVWKLVYMYMLGYNVEVGHMVAIGMVGSKSIMVKQVGYTACSILFTEKSELLRLVIQTLKVDLASSNDILQSLALVFIANIGNAEFAEALSIDVQRLLFHPQTRAIVRKKAALALLRLFRKNPDCIPQEDDFPKRVVALLDDGNIGVLTAITSLVLGLVSINPAGYEDVVAKATVILTKVCFADPRNRSVYKYYNTICPWLQVKLLRLLQYFPTLSAGLAKENGKVVISSNDDIKSASARLHHVLNELCARTVLTKNVNKNNGDHSILFEAIHLIITMARTCHTQLPADSIPQAITDLVTVVASLLAKFISVQDANYRYLGLDNLARLALIPGSLQGIRQHQSVILAALHDLDISLRKRALDLLYAICDETNVEVVVGQMCDVLYNEALGMREEIVLKIVVLAEKYAGTTPWYVKTVMQLATTAGKYLTDEIWFRIVQVLTNNEQLQTPAVLEAYARIVDPELHSHSVRLLSYILGEFTCKALDDEAVAAQVDAHVLFARLQAQFRVADSYTRALMLCSYAKLAFTIPDVKANVDKVMETSASSLDIEVQQRASELLILSKQDVSLLELVLDVMPPYEDLDSARRGLEHTMKKAALGTTDRDIWTQPEPDVETEVHSSAAAADDDEDAPQEEEEEEVNNDENEAYPEQRLNLVVKATRGEDAHIYKGKNLTMTCKLVVDDQATGKMVLVVTNTSNQTINNVAITLPTSDAYRVQAKPMSFPSLAPGASDRFLLLWQSIKPTDSFPVVKISFTTPATGSVSGGANNSVAGFDLLGLFDDSSASSIPMTLTVKLPVLSTNFIVPNTTVSNAGTPIDGSSYLTYWRQLGNQAIAKLQASSASYTTPAAITKLIDSRALPFAVISDCDTNANNLYLSGTFVSQKRDSNGNNVKVDVLVRIETKAGSPVCRVTINSGSTSVSSAVMSAITSILFSKVVG